MTPYSYDFVDTIDIPLLQFSCGVKPQNTIDYFKFVRACANGALIVYRASMVPAAFCALTSN